MLAELFGAIVRHAESRVRIVTVEESPNQKTNQVLVDGNKVGDAFVIEAMPPKHVHQFGTLEGFMSYLNSEHAEPENDETHIIFVGGDFVTANMSYRSNIVHEASLPLHVSEEFNALMELTKGVSQKELWRALVTDLADSFPISLRLAISNLAMTNTEGRQVQISDVGLSEESAQRKATIIFPSQKAGETDTTKELDLDWSFVGRFRECFDHVIKVPIRIELSVEQGEAPIFTFHPLGLPTIMREYRHVLVAHIIEGVDSTRFTVHEGIETSGQTAPGAHKGYSY